MTNRNRTVALPGRTVVNQGAFTVILLVLCLIQPVEPGEMLQNGDTLTNRDIVGTRPC